MRFLWCFLVGFIALFPNAAHAKRGGFYAVGYYVKQMDLAVIVDVDKISAPDFKQKLQVREVLQGNAKVGDILILPGRISSESISLRPDSSVAVLLKKEAADAASGASWQVLQAYDSPQSIADLRLLLGVYQLPTERQQLLALQKIVRDEKTATQEQMLVQELVFAFSHMREATNFDLIESALPLFNEAQRADFMTVLGTMNDLRAVPLLLSALDNASKKIRGTAAQTLTYRYPGAPGVTEAMRALLHDEQLKRTAQDYLSKRDASIKVEFPSTPFHEAKALFLKDKTEGARALLGVMENKESGIFAGTSIISWTGEEILPFLDENGKRRLRALILRQAAEQGDYLQSEHLLKLIGLMPDMNLVPALQNLLHNNKPKSLYYKTDKSDMIATFALRNLGPRARELGTIQALKNLQMRLDSDKKPNAEEVQTLLMQVAFLADAATWRSVPENIDKQWRPLWENLLYLRLALGKAVAKEDEAQALVGLLKNPPQELNSDARNWIIYRLGDLRAQAAVGFLFQEMSERYFYFPYAAKEALIQIGGGDVDKGAVKLLNYPKDEVRRQAMEILMALRGDKMRPLLRGILSEPDSTRKTDFGYKMDAVSMLGGIGTPDDLPLLMPYADFWKADRTVQYWAASSIASIRERFAYDVNGPIQKK